MQRLKALVSTAPVMLLARFAGGGAGFLTQLMLARLLAPEALGMFFAATSLAAVLGLVAAQGYPELVQRLVTRYRQKSRADLLGGFVAQILRETWVAGLACSALLVAVAFLPLPLVADLRGVIIAAAVLTLASVSFSIYPAIACADRRFAVGLLPEGFLRSVFFLAVIALVWTISVALTAGIAIALYAGVSGVLALAQFVMVRNSLSSRGRKPAKRLRRRWRAEGRPLLVVALFNTLFADLVILLASPFLGAEALAPFGIALKIAMLVGFAVQVTHQIALPDLAEANQRRDPARMIQALLRSTLFPAGVTLTVLVGTIAWGDQILGLFGPAYPVVKWGLVILIAAQFIRAVAGPAPLLLTLKGAQRTNAAISVVCCGVLLAANAALIPLFGIIGACLSVLIVVLTWMGASAVMLHRQADIRTDILFALRHGQAGARLALR